MLEDPENDQARYYLASTYEELKQYEDSAREFMGIEPESRLFVNSRLHLAFLLTELDRADEALELVDEALALKKDDSRLLLALGSLYETRKDYPRALEALDRARGIGARGRGTSLSARRPTGQDGRQGMRLSNR